MRALVGAATLAAVVACGNAAKHESKVDGGSDCFSWYRDQDGDGTGTELDSLCVDSESSVPSGYARFAGDCDDSDPHAVFASMIYVDKDGDGASIATGATSRCGPPPAGFTSAIPSPPDCDDDDPARTRVRTFYGDGDGDGFGGPGASAQNFCAGSAPPGYSDNARDCDDDDPAAQSIRYRDSDGDGFGDDAASRCVGLTTPGYADASGDCDDADPLRHPGAAEIFFDGVDSNCDGEDNFTGCIAADGTPVNAYPTQDVVPLPSLDGGSVESSSTTRCRTATRTTIL